MIINIKGYPVKVVKMKVSDLDKSKCSNKFNKKLLEGIISLDGEVYVKCDEQNNLIIPPRTRYSIFKIKESV